MPCRPAAGCGTECRLQQEGRVSVGEPDRKEQSGLSAESLWEIQRLQGGGVAVEEIVDKN